MHSQKKKAGRVTCDEKLTSAEPTVRYRFMISDEQNRHAPEDTYDGLQPTGMVA